MKCPECGRELPTWDVKCGTCVKLRARYRPSGAAHIDWMDAEYIELRRLRAVDTALRQAYSGYDGTADSLHGIRLKT